MTTRLGQIYEAFLKLADAGTPEDAIKEMELFGAQDELIQQVIDHHEQEMIKIREREEPRAVVRDNHRTWYTGPQSRDRCWPAMERLLRKDGWPDSAVNDLDAASSKVVSLLSHPRQQTFSTRGLVVGYVQSGKTTNFTAVMAKAADRGYKLFIVLAGIHNGLRRQTQRRLIHQLVDTNPSRWMQLTEPDRDFVPPANAAAYFAQSNDQHVLCVIKKNPTVLRKFRGWLGSASAYLKDCPALIIDDEADQATVATNTINPLIRDILDRLPKSAYVGYTATPFANLLIDPAARDLYPEHFIVNLPKPAGHFGTEVLFGRDVLDGEDPEEVFDGYDMIREVPLGEVELVRPSSRSDAEGFAPTICGSLRKAVMYFWASTAARRVRGEGNRHCTMLIHTSVNTAVHNSFHRPLKHVQEQVEAALAFEDPLLLGEFRDLWDSETARVPAKEFGEEVVDFAILAPKLLDVVRDCRIIMDNSSSKDRLDYEGEPVVAIAVGGNTLSRGLTLEGLSVSYFVRSVSAYDTLLQMGRWFGYRNGYADLPRIWMTAELREWFRHLATVESEMRRDIDVYMVEDKTPMTFAVRLRTHPSLRVTAAAKMTSAVTAESAYGGHRVQTRYFHLDGVWLLNNQNAAKVLVDEVVRCGARHEDRSTQGRHVFRGVPYELVVDFLENYRFHEKSQECDGRLLQSYIERRVARAASLRQWNVAIIGNSSPSGATGAYEFAPGVTVPRVTRSALSHDEVTRTVDIKTLMSRRDAVVDLDLTDITGEITEERIKDLRRRLCPGIGLLTLYPIDKDSHPAPRRTDLRHPLGADHHVVGIGLVFPRPDGEDSSVEWQYVSADLSQVDIEEEDLSGLDVEDI